MTSVLLEEGLRMSITLKNLYQETGKYYQIQLVAGESGLSREVAWVQFCEEPDNTEFFRGNDLIITTGLCLDDGDWLLAFMRKMVAHKSAGLILNVGKYIKPEHITAAVHAFCEQEAFALFVIPWHIRLGDVMEDYCNRLFRAKQQETDLVELVRTAVFQPEKSPLVEQELCVKGLAGDEFAVLVWRVEGKELEEAEKNNFLLSIKAQLNQKQKSYVIFWHQKQILALIFHPDESSLQSLLEAVANLGSRLLQGQGKLVGGCSSFYRTAACMYKAYHEAVSALAMAVKRGKPYLTFSDLGVYRLVFAVDDQDLLHKLHDEQLAELKAYDEGHHSQLLPTLRAYLLAGGSLQGTAEAMFTHRNTISYRLGKIREIVPFDLASAEDCFALMMAFYIEDYQSALARTKEFVQDAQ